MWQPYPKTDQHTVTGDLRLARSVHSPQLDNQRDLLVWLPPGYENSNQHYPVIYMHDGQNLFDRFTSYSGEWEVDETMTRLSAEGLPAIIVGLPNMNTNRVYEYTPYPEQINGQTHQGRGDLYVRFLTETVKPLIDSAFRTRPEVAATGIAGSSMGGLISLYAMLSQPSVFGFCGAFSTAYWFGQMGLLDTIAEKASGGGHIYLDVGGKEGPTLDYWLSPSEANNGYYLDGVRALRDALIGKGYREGANLMYVEDPAGPHREPAWAARLPAAFRYLLSRVG
jgi:predicted alpha/beta superfamily hydrolase